MITLGLDGEGSAGQPAPPRPAPPRGLLRALLRLPVHLYHAHLGVLLGHRFLMLIHTGRRTGGRHETVLEVIRYEQGAREAVVAAGWGRRTQLGGIGFTMSLFVGDLAYGESPALALSKIAILAASVIAGVGGYLILRSTRSSG